MSADDPSSALLAAAQAGDPRPQFELALALRAGRPPFPRDPEAVVEWTRRAAVGGHADAQYALGGFLENGWHCDPDHAEAVLWYRRAAAQGHADAAEVLAAIAETQAANGAAAAPEPAEPEPAEPDSLFRDAVIFERYGEGPEDLAAAIELYVAAEAAGHPLAACCQGLIWGLGGAGARALACLRRAAAAGSAEGAFLYALALEEGLDDEPDPEAAWLSFRAAERLGLPVAAAERARLDTLLPLVARLELQRQARP